MQNHVRKHWRTKEKNFLIFICSIKLVEEKKNDEMKNDFSLLYGTNRWRQSTRPTNVFHWRLMLSSLCRRFFSMIFSFSFRMIFAMMKFVRHWSDWMLEIVENCSMKLNVLLKLLNHCLVLNAFRLLLVNHRHSDV